MISPVHVLGLLQLLLKIQLKNERFMLRLKKNELTDRFGPAIDRSIQKQPQEMFYKTAVLKNFAIFV